MNAHDTQLSTYLSISIHHLLVLQLVVGLAGRLVLDLRDPHRHLQMIGRKKVGYHAQSSYLAINLYLSIYRHLDVVHLAVALGAVVVEGTTLEALRDDRVEREPDKGKGKGEEVGYWSARAGRTCRG